MEKAKIELQGISKSYYSETSVTQALRKISLTFEHGEFVAITGESGSGKSTLLNIIGGMDTFDEGEMFVNGQPTFQYNEDDWEDYRRSNIGYIFQDYSLIGHYTALDNVISALLIMGKNKSEAKDIAYEYLKRVGLEGFEMHPATELSSGQKQRLSIARALAKNTGIIIADEPTGNLDSETGRQIVELLKELSKNSLVIMVTHNYSQAEPYITRKIRIHDGMVVSDVSGSNLISDNEEYQDLTYNKNEFNSNVNDKNDDNEIDKDTFENIIDENETELSFKEKLNLSIHNFIIYNKLAKWFAHKNIKTQAGRVIMFTGFLLVISIVSFLLIGELQVNADDIFTKEYSKNAFYHDDSTRLVVKHTDGSAMTNDDVEKISKLRYVETVDTCDLANDINFYLEKNKDYKYIFGKAQRENTGGKLVSFINNNRFMKSTDCITSDDIAEGRLPESRNEIVLYSDDKSIIGTEILCYFTATNIWDTNEYYQTNLTVSGILKEESDNVYFSKELCNMLSMHAVSGIYKIYFSFLKSINDYKFKPVFIPIINDKLEGNQACLSVKSEYELEGGTVRFTYQDRDDSGNLSKELIEDELQFTVPRHDSTEGFIEVSEEFYYKYYNKENKQSSVYISSYAKTDNVIRSLTKAGYKAVSTYRVSTTEYIEELVNERLIIICISAFGLIIILLAEVLILRSLMKIRVKDYFVLKFIGMQLPVIRKISYHEIFAYSCVSIIITIIIMFILRTFNIPIISEIMWYYSIWAYLQFILYNIILGALSVAAFNHLLKGRLRE